MASASASSSAAAAVSKVRTCLWFQQSGEEAAQFYVSLFPDDGSSKIEHSSPYTVLFTLAGAPYMILNGGAAHQLSPAASIMVKTVDQEETDRLWQALAAEDGRCGWLVDRYGVSWQIVPQALGDLLSSGDRDGAQRVHQAMMRMGKIDIAALHAAFDNSNDNMPRAAADSSSS